ncbi:nucleoside hydrolase [Fredinandcohnia quinoae]|uniref:Nucleoside hydrolase n=1 Tax=Fredinandcohnia quinoae TaxID=2918902 RepID=A0AAW5E242_9BACI|nr:nucleoside hydrolase [Fredinandcohnia sp. SECRCQ15]MCH1626971.1 nucleoside hydrolase [Fredinandcohnia sp. SECRCQ15]
MAKVLLFCDPGIDDSLAIMYGLLNPTIEIVGIVPGYGNVTQEQATDNVAFLLQLAGKKDIPIIAGAKGPLTGEFTPYYPEIHGQNGLGPIQPPDTIKGELLNFDEIFKLIERYENDLYIVDVGRSTSLAIAFILGGNIMRKVKAFYIMGGAFLVPGNVTSEAEANFHGDPIASNLVVEKAHNLSIFPLNVTNHAILTPQIVDYIIQFPNNPYHDLIKPIFNYYFNSYKKNVPGIQGTPLHDVIALSAIVNPSVVHYIRRRVTVDLFGKSRGRSVADFRPKPEKQQPDTLDRIAISLNYKIFMEDFMKVMTQGTTS